MPRLVGLTFLCTLAGLAAPTGAVAASSVEIHYAPHPFVIEALRDAADRGVTIRLYLDKSQYSQHGPRSGGPTGELLGFPNVYARVKGRGVLMHLKAYAVDGERLRTGSGNFSQSGLALQLVDDATIVAKFEANLQAIWSRGANASAAAAAEPEPGGPR